MAATTSYNITLIATIGSSPAVLTEAVYALHKQGLWPVTEVEIITTAHGAGKIRDGLFGKQQQWAKLCMELGIDPYFIKIPPVPELKGVPDGQGGELVDTRNAREDRLMATYIQQVVRRHTADADKQVFALLSGGRKTMSSHLMSAMQLFGRRHDRLFHLLVSEPYETINGFYFPTRDSLMLERKTLKGEVIGQYDASEAEIDLIDIPYLRLRSYLSKYMDYSKSFDELLAEADEQLLDAEEYPVHDLQIHLNGPQESRLYINGREHPGTLPPRQLAILATYVWENISAGKPRDISWHDIVKDEDKRDAMGIFYRTAAQGNYEGLSEEARRINIREVAEQDEWLDYEHWHDDDDKPLKRSFGKHKSEIISALNEILAAHEQLQDLRVEHLWQESGNKRLSVVKKLYKVPVPPERCRITGLHEKDAQMLGLEEEL